jgi:hypothetical protein
MSTNSMRPRVWSFARTTLVTGLALSIVACQSSTAPAQISSFNQSGSWNCASDVSCQDVYDFQLTAGAMVSFKVTAVSSGSVAAIAVYGPNVTLGGTNLLTGDTTELLCNFDNNCSDGIAGQDVENFSIPTTGTYRFAVTRNWGDSCGATGTYQVAVNSATTFASLGQTVKGAASLASGVNCPAK